jgi:hypothetical protein
MKGRVPSVLGYILEAEEAARCGITVPTLRKWRRRGYGPKAVKIGRTFMYSDDADTQFLADQATAVENALKPRPRGRPRRSGTASADRR